MLTVALVAALLVLAVIGAELVRAACRRQLAALQPQGAPAAAFAAVEVD